MRETAERYAARCRPFESVAVRIARVAFTGSDYGETSNGDTVVAIIRGRIVQTYMLRRRQQPFTRTALSVDRTVAL